MQEQHFRARLIMFCVGIFCMTFAIALSCKADLGTSPISSVPWVLSMATPWSVGVLTIIMNVVFIVLQPIILRAVYLRELLGQLVTTLAFGYSIDFSMNLLSWFTPGSYLEQWGACLLSIVILSFGIFLEVRAKIFLAAGEGIVNVLAFVSRKKFSLWKNCFDICLVAISIVISLTEFDALQGVGLGTVAAAVLVGRLVYLYELKLHFFDKWKVKA